ncbi:MAG: archease [Chloroflexi bacterium]|nr:archease [Chloroflexota bacterium]
MDAPVSGFRELAHTADWALAVWAPNLAGLLREAAAGMYALCQIELEDGPAEAVEFSLPAAEPELLLVGFLSELVFLAERDRLAFPETQVEVGPGGLQARMAGRRIRRQMKEIKAVTHHNLHIEQDARGLRAEIVFDV